MALGGRAAEDIMFDGVVTNGASNDIQQVTNIAKTMVQIYGMNDAVGQVSFQNNSGQQVDKITSNNIR